MAQDFTKKLLGVAGNAAGQSRAFLIAIDTLLNDSEILAQTGGDFPEAIFDGSQFAYMTPQQANIFLNTVVPAIHAFLDTHIEGNVDQPTMRQSLQMMISDPY